MPYSEPDVEDTHGSLLLCLPISCCSLLSGTDPRNVILVLALRRFAVSCCVDPVSDLPSISPLWTPIPSDVSDYIPDFSHFLSVLKWNQAFLQLYWPLSVLTARGDLASLRK